MKLRTPLLTSGVPTRGWTRPVRRSALAVVTSAAVLGVAGCSVFSPPTVLKPYAPSDGSQTTVGGVEVRNVLMVSSGVDEPGVLSAVLVNSGSAPADVSVSVDVDAGSPTTEQFTVAQNASVHIGDPGAVADDAASTDDDAGDQEQVAWLQVPQVPVVPGQTVPVTFTVNGQNASVNAQVLRPCFEYATVTPTVPAPTSTPTSTATSSPGATEGAEGTPTATGTPSTSTSSAAASPTISCGPVTGEEQGLLGEDEEGGEG
ncbi:hypothetical protein AB1207_23365 [Kineococcus endophyticus]|uniref:Copper(I)-binding protein n=1 Tax=Kineococcus endophyticus TaxID=1181883 RepID=A0ABV3PE18_9ACTN